MKDKTYTFGQQTLQSLILSMSKEERKVFAREVGSAFGHINNAAYGLVGISPSLAMRLEKASKGRVRCEDLAPDEPWSYIRGSKTPRRPTLPKKK